MPFQECLKKVSCCANASQIWLVFHMSVLAMFDMLAYSMCLVPTITLLRKISFANGTGGTSSSTQAFNTADVVLSSAFAFLSGPVIGALSDVVGRFPLLSFTRIMRLLFGLALVIAWYFWQLHGIITFIFLAYCVQGFADPNMAISIFYAMITDVFAPEERTAMFGIISAVFAVPVIIGPLIAVPIEDAYGTDTVFLIGLFLLSANCVYVSLVFPETLQEFCKKEERKKVLLQAANPFRSLAALCCNKTPTSGLPIIALAAIYFFFSMAGASLQSTIIVYISDPITLNWPRAYQQYTLAGFASLLVLSQSLGIKLCIMLLKIRLTVLLGLVLLCAGLITMAISQTNAVLFLIGLFLSGLSYLALPALNGLVSSQVSCKEQGKILASFAAVRSLGVASGQLSGGVALAYFSNEGAFVVFPGATFALSAGFAGIGALIFIVVSCRQKCQGTNDNEDSFPDETYGSPNDDGNSPEQFWTKANKASSMSMSASVPGFRRAGLLSGMFFNNGSIKSFDFQSSSSKSSRSFYREVAFSAPVLSGDLIQKGFGHLVSLQRSGEQFPMRPSIDMTAENPREESTTSITSPLLFSQHVLPNTPTKDRAGSADHLPPREPSPLLRTPPLRPAPNPVSFPPTPSPRGVGLGPPRLANSPSPRGRGGPPALPSTPTPGGVGNASSPRGSGGPPALPSTPTPGGVSNASSPRGSGGPAPLPTTPTTSPRGRGAPPPLPPTPSWMTPDTTD